VSLFKFFTIESQYLGDARVTKLKFRTCLGLGT